MSYTYNIPKHRRGDTWKGLTIGLSVNGAPVDLSDSQIDMELREDYDSPTVLRFSTLNSTISVLPSLTAFKVFPQAINIPPAVYKYDIQVVTNVSSITLSSVDTYMDGTWEIYYDVTDGTTSSSDTKQEGAFNVVNNWGFIDGDISTQSDLWSYLSAARFEPGIRTFVNPLTSDNFLVLNINGTRKAIQLFDFTT